MHGWIKLNRSLMQHDLWLKETFTKGQAWVDILLMAQYEPGEQVVAGLLIEIDRGEISTSEAALSLRWGWSRGKVKRFINELEMNRMVKQKRTPLGLLLKVVNYDVFQAVKSADGHQTDTKTDTKRTQNGHLQEEKNYKNDKNNSACAREDDLIEFPENVRAALASWFSYKAERGSKYRATGRKTLLNEARRRLKQIGPECVIWTITNAIASNLLTLDFDRYKQACASKPAVYDSGRYDYEEIRQAARKNIREKIGKEGGRDK